MSEIRFVNELGDVLERAARQRGGGVRRVGKRMRLVVAAAALSLAAGVAIAATTGSPTRLVVQPISCYAGMSLSPFGRSAQGLETGGRNPIEICALALHMPRRAFIACSHPGPLEYRWRGRTWSADPFSRVFVLAADGRPNQCARLGMTNLPASYKAGSADVRALVASLRAAYELSNCTTKAALVADTRRILIAHGLSTWKVDVLTQLHFQWAGRCAAYLPAGPSLSDPPALSGTPAAVEIVDHVASRSVIALLQHLPGASAARCESVRGAEQVVRQAIGAVVPGATVRYAITSRPAGNRLNPRWLNERYGAGCAVVFETYPSVDDRTFRVLLVSKFAPTRFGPPPPSAYR